MLITWIAEACRLRLKYPKKYESPEAAERHFYKQQSVTAIDASEHLLKCGRSNVVYGVEKAIGTKRADKSDSRLPAKRMPMGLLEHMVNFYNADSYNRKKHLLVNEKRRYRDG